MTDTPMTNKQAPDRQTLCTDPECWWSAPHVQGRPGCKWAAPDDSGDFAGCYWEPGDEGVKALVEKLLATCRGDGILTLFAGDLVNPDGPEAAARLVELPRLQSDNARLREALLSIAEGNLGDHPWQANYDRIREIARAALTLSEGDGE